MNESRVRVWLPRLVVVYVVFVIVVWAVLRFLADRWWLATVACFGPRWLAAAPLIVLVPAALRVKKRLWLIPLALAGLVVFFPVLGFNIPSKVPFSSGKPDLRVMTYNVGEIEHADIHALKALVDEIEPDIVTLQECTKFERGLSDVFTRWYVHVDQGLCFMSRYPIRNIEARDRRDIWKMHGSGSIDRYELDTPKGSVFVENVHLATVREALSEVMRRAWKGASKMRANTEQRDLESKIALEWAEQTPGPLVVAGDFNMPVDSAIYRERWSGLKNAFNVAGFGFGTTKATGWFGIRIDHVLAGPAWEFLGAHVERHLGGDHRPMVADLRLVTPGTAPSGRPPGSAAPTAAPDTSPLPVVDASISTPVTSHPRLWLRADDLPKYRGWAVASNPIYAAGLYPLAARAKKEMDSGKLDNAPCSNGSNSCETYAELFAFMSLVDPDEAARADWQHRAASILTAFMKRIDDCSGTDDTLKRDDKLCRNIKELSTHDRSAASGEAFALATDWIYPALSADDKKLIRTVMFRWAEENLHASATGNNHPLPIGVVRDPGLLKRKGLRYGASASFAAHMRNLTHDAIALDAADDPAEPGDKHVYPRLRDYLDNATGAWLYQNDWVLRNDAAGGLPPDGPQWGAETLGYVAQTFLALQSAGEVNPQKYGRHVVVEDSPFWRDRVKAFLHSMSPGPIGAKSGPSYVAAWYGDGQAYQVPDYIDSFGPLGILASRRGDKDTFDAARWIERVMAPGGEAGLTKRAGALDGRNNFRRAILYFLLFDPTAPPAVDPRPKLPLDHLAAGLGQLFSRTGWGEDAAWFHSMVGWENMEHRHGDANDFDFWRKGEWLTKERMGDSQAFGLSDQHNTVSIENDKPASDRLGEGRQTKWEHGSQWPLHHLKDPSLVAHAFSPAYAYALGDATGVYNDPTDDLDDVTHASRSTLWIKPDWIVVYDRATTGKPDRFKRFWLQTADVATVAGNVATARSAAGQSLFVTSLLPAGATLTAAAYKGDPRPWKLVPGEPMKATLSIEPQAKSADVRFLTVLEGADAGATAKPVELVESKSGTPFAGAAIGDAIALFPVSIGAVTEVHYEVGAAVKRHFVTGLEPGAGYDVARSDAGGRTAIAIKPGGAQKTDEGGVLAF